MKNDVLTEAQSGRLLLLNDKMNRTDKSKLNAAQKEAVSVIKEIVDYLLSKPIVSKRRSK